MHIASALDWSGPEPAGVLAYATWTEKVDDGVYEVMYTSEYYPYGSFDRGPDIAYYDCHVGDSTLSRYCRARDGRALWRGRGVDYAKDRLSYHLPYLNPHRIYKLRAVLYQSSNSTWEQSLAFDSRTAGRVSYRPDVPETAWVTIPRELYRKDFGVDLDIDRISGDYASVAQLRLYEIYPFLAEGSGKEFLPVAEPTEGLLEVAGANPFRNRAQVRYTVPTAQQVTVRVYDIQGRAVRELASGPHAAGAYSLNWNGTDSRGRRVAAGAYFIELKTETTGSIRKVVYAP